MTAELMKRESENSALPELERAERTRTRRVFVPRTDIYETADSIIVLADMPGVSESSIDITVEKNTLTIDGTIEDSELPGYSAAYCEYVSGDFHRVFTLSNEVDREGIVATVKNGVLRLSLPKSKTALARKIAVQAG